jgi:hypothetical protein
MNTTILIIFQILALVLTAYLIYYAREKGKNQASKDDLKELTKIVEDVKKENLKELELLKANLLVFSDKEKQIYSEEKEATIIFFAQLNNWIWDSLNIYIYEYNHSNYQEIASRLILMRDNYNKTNVTFSKVKLIVDDEELIMAGHEAISKTLKLHHFVEGLLQRLSSNLGWEKIMVNRVLNKEIDFLTLSGNMQDYYKNEAKSNSTERKIITAEYFSQHNETFDPAINSINNFKTLAKKYLRK